MALITDENDLTGVGREQPTTSGKTLWLIIAVSLGIHVGCFVLSRTVLESWRWEHHPLHASVEMGGGLIALLVALLLLSLDRQKLGTSFNTWIAGGLVGMGLLDGMHALVHVGQPFVWLHSLATFLGGLLFSMVWLPKRWAERVSPWWAWAVFATVLSIAVLSVIAPDLTPSMLVPGANGNLVFSSWAVALNVGGGVLLLIAAGQLVRTYLKTHNTDDLLFFLHCLLFGAAAIMFQQSQLWDLTWWGWHLLRLMAYAVAFWFVLLTIHRDQELRLAMSARLKNTNDILENRVAERTQKLEQSEKFVRHKNSQLDRLNTELLEFAYSTSHDLKAPLASITGLLGFCESDLEEGEIEEVRTNIQKAKELAQRLANRVESILTLAKSDMESGNLESIHVLQRVQHAWDSLPHDGVALETSFEHADPVQSVSVRFDAILENLLSNAIKYQDPEQAEKVVRVSTWMSNDDFFLSVEDNGVGIPKEYHDKVFRLFHRLANNDKSGTGIGLPLVKKSITRLGGNIELQSNNGSTTFTVSLPQSGDVVPTSMEMV